MPISKPEFFKLIKQASQPVKSWGKTKAVQDSVSRNEKRIHSRKTANDEGKRNGKSR